MRMILILVPALTYAATLRADDRGPRMEDEELSTLSVEHDAPEVDVAETNEEPDVADDAGPSKSVSIGRASRGRLLHGVPLEDSDWLSTHDRGSRYGTAELVGLIEHAARKVAHAYPGAVLQVGDLSRKKGGRLRPHRSHRTGRDADVGFYVMDEHGMPAQAPRFLRMNAKGRGVYRGTTYQLDDAKNWALIEALLDYPHARVQYIFVARSLRKRLLKEGERQGATEEILELARKVVQQPSRGSAHRTHFHLRIHCPEDDLPRCLDLEPRKRKRRRKKRR